MKESSNRWSRRLLWVLPALLAAYLLVKLADFVWYRSQVPVGFQDAKWSGRWESKGYGGLSGRLLVRLPDPLPENEDFKVEALVYYSIHSVWKPGQFVNMDFSGRYRLDAPTPRGRSTNPIPASGVLKFKGLAGRQVMEYSALVDETQTRIVGGYLSHDPYDYGLFFIRYY